ncbi:MAG: OmpA family protein [Cytophagaceae bacterium]|nr:OmpA family protein [Cytophagaceae bacterium]
MFTTISDARKDVSLNIKPLGVIPTITLYCYINMIHRLFLGWFSLLCLYVHAQNINVAGLRQGARMVRMPASYFTSIPTTPVIDLWSARALMDETAQKGWCSASSVTHNNIFVIEFSELMDVRQVIFDNECQKEYKGISTRKIKVRFSDKSSSEGYQDFYEWELSENKNDQLFPVSAQRVHWMEVTIVNNYGHPQWTELMECRALGNYSQPTVPTINPLGTWKSNFDWVSFNTSSMGMLYGCYAWSQGEIFNVKINRRVVRFDWYQPGNGHRGWCLLIGNQEGTQLNGIWGFSNSTEFGFWECERFALTSQACATENSLGKVEQPVKVKKGVDVTLALELVDIQTQKGIPVTVRFPSLSTQLVTTPEGIVSTSLDTLRNKVVIRIESKGYYPKEDTIVLTSTEKAVLYAYRKFQLYPLGIGKAIVLDNVLFYQSKSTLLPTSFTALDQLADVLQQNPTFWIELSGHTDNQGDEAKNIDLSKERAEVVKTYLVSKGIAPERMVSIGYGSKFPRASNSTENSRRLNRRVECKIIRM